MCLFHIWILLKSAERRHKDIPIFGVRKTLAGVGGRLGLTWEAVLVILWLDFARR